MWNWTSWNSEPATVVVPFTMTSIVVPRFSNSTSCSGMLRTGFSVATVTEASDSRVRECLLGRSVSIHTDVDGRLV